MIHSGSVFPNVLIPLIFIFTYQKSFYIALEYAGVFVATSVLSASVATACFNCAGVFYGIGFSTGTNTAADRVDVYDAFSASMAITNNAKLIAKLYNITNTSASLNSAGYYMVPKPIRFSEGLYFKPSVGTYDLINCLYYKWPD